MHPLPAFNRGDQLLIQVWIDGPVVEFVLEIVGDLFEINLPRIVHIFIGHPRPGNADAVLMGPGEVGA